MSELQALDHRYQSYQPEGVLFQLPTLGKKRTVGAPPKQLMFGAFLSDRHLCVMKYLRQYETDTLIHRKNDLSSSQPLFLSYVKPHKPVTSQWLANWLKEILRKAGIDTH